ncbi:MAG TPA: DinB family protein [Chitinophagales bacterium]|nr:DinB family protein [Chitinophagales bacterium]
MTQPEILHDLAAAFADVEKIGNNFPEAQFFKRPDNGKWSAGENIQHLFLSVKPLVGLFGKPQIMEQFGKRNRPGMGYNEIVNRYHEKLKNFSSSGIVNTVDGISDTQAAQMENLHSIHQKFLERAATLPEEVLDDYQIPHPLLGLLTPREFLHFTRYHTLHHAGVVLGLIK